MRGYLTTKKLDFTHIFLRLFELLETFISFVLVQLETEGVLDHFTALVGTRREDTICFTLRDDMVSRSSYMSLGEEFGDVLESDCTAVYIVLVDPIAMDDSFETDFIKIKWQNTFCIIENYFYRSTIYTPPIKNEIFTTLSAHRLYRLFTEHKAKCLSSI